MHYRVALVDDDAEYGAELSSFLESHGCRVALYQTGARFFDALTTSPPDILILDHRLRGEDGIAVLRRLRETSSLPCIMLTGGVSEVDRILSLEFGADDHVGKSASPRELLARIAAVLRRSVPRAETGTQGWRIDEMRRDVLRADGRSCGLTAAEFRLLSALATRTGQVVPRETLFAEALERPWQADDRSVDVLIGKVRKKLEGQDCIRSVRGQGYLFTGFGGA